MDSNTNTLPQAVERPALRSGDLFGLWQPIDTAPRGQTVLLYVANAFGHKHVKTGIAYPTNHPDLQIVSVFDDGDALGYLPEKHATHWMPLPAAPNESAPRDDTQRINWLEEQNGRLQFEAEDEASLPHAVVYLPSLENGEGTWREAARGDDFREAIDAAMRGPNVGSEPRRDNASNKT